MGDQPPGPLPARILSGPQRILTPRRALQVTLLVAWVNFLGTTKWAHLAGALNGWKRPWYGLALACLTILALLPHRGAGRVRLGRLPMVAALMGGALLVVAFFASFPLASWWRLPFLDDWPPRLQTTLDGINLLRRGAVSGWQWAFLGGYHTSSNIAQSLALVGFVPVGLLGPQLGFHLLHALLLAPIPLLLFWDLRQEGDSDLAWLTAAFACVTTTGIFGTIMPSGDTNSIAGMTCVLLALAGSRAARLGRRWGPPALVLGLVLAIYSHVGFFSYAAAYLALEALYYRDLRSAVRSAAALAVAALAGLPLFWEYLLYPGYTRMNNVLVDPAATPSFWETTRKVYYNVEMLVQPHRWFNDYGSLTLVFLPVVACVAVRLKSRAGFYAWAALLTVGMLRLDTPEFGYLFIRVIHMQVILAPPVLAAFILEFSGRRALAVSLVAVIVLYVQTSFAQVPHVSDIREFNRELVDRVATLDGNLILIEGNPHRNMNLTPGQRSVRSRFGTHFEAYLADATGKRFYGTEWDGWVWSRFRSQVMAGGTLRGRAIEATALPAFVAELHKWGIRHLLVWSEPSKRYLEANDACVKRWVSDPWVEFELLDADTRAVVVPVGAGVLRNIDMLGADVDLIGVHSGESVVVRTNFYPAWHADVAGQPVPLFAVDGQLAFQAPRTGTYRVHLEYPRRTPLLVFSLLAFVGGMCVLIPLRGRRTH